MEIRHPGSFLKISHNLEIGHFLPLLWRGRLIETYLCRDPLSFPSF